MPLACVNGYSVSGPVARKCSLLTVWADGTPSERIASFGLANRLGMARALLSLTRLLAQSYVLAPRRFAGNSIEADMIEIALVCESCGSIIARGTTTASCVAVRGGGLYNRREGKGFMLAVSSDFAART